MGNYVIIILLAVILIIAAVSAVKHFKGEGGCCGGGGDYKPRKKKLNRVVATKVFSVEGMHCEHCSNRVTEAVNDIPETAGVVNLKKGTVTVFYESDIPDEVITAKIERLSYRVTGISAE